jgi:hypothetical protein
MALEARWNEAGLIVALLLTVTCVPLSARELTASPKRLSVALHDDFADVAADGKPHLLTGRSVGVLLGYSLHFDRALHGIHSTGEIGKDAVARGVENPTR